MKAVSLVFWFVEDKHSHHIALERRFGLATIDYNAPQRIWALNRGHIVLFLLHLLLLLLLRPSCPLRLNVNFRSKSENMLWSFSGRQMGRVEGGGGGDNQRVPPPVKRTQVYSLTDTFLSFFFNGEHNFGFLRRKDNNKGGKENVQK